MQGEEDSIGGSSNSVTFFGFPEGMEEIVSSSAQPSGRSVVAQAWGLAYPFIEAPS